MVLVLGWGIQTHYVKVWSLTTPKLSLLAVNVSNDVSGDENVDIYFLPDSILELINSYMNLGCSKWALSS